jgi:very-short-patch-repair endonuclease/predicted transcriptional regulator of viral defense system
MRVIRPLTGEGNALWRLYAGMRQKVATGLTVAEIAARQHGAISTTQLLATGLSLSGIARRARDGRLHRIHQGVYAVGHSAPSPSRSWMAAVLACGRQSPQVAHGDQPPLVLDLWGAALSYVSAARLWQLLPPREGPVDVSIPGGGGKARRRGMRVHRPRLLLPAHVTLRNGIPVTTPSRTIADLHRVISKPDKTGLISARELRRAVRQAEVLGLPLGDEIRSDSTRSDLESDFLRLCRRLRLPAPEVNVRVGPHLVDFLWRDRRLIVETDGYEYHRGRRAFQDDRGRDLDLRERGFEVIRLSEKQLNEEPRRVAEVVAAALRVGADGRGSEDREESRGGDG